MSEQLKPAQDIDEAEMASLHEEGAKAWAFLGDRSASDCVDEIRGNEETCSVLIEGEAHEVSMPVAAELLRLNMLIQQRQDCEPVGYFRCTLDGWIGCAETDEGARPLYEAPPKREPLSLDRAILDAMGAHGGHGLGLQKTKSGWSSIPHGCLTAVRHPDLRSALKSALGIGGQS